ncbi:MAG: DUF4129 domain-containing protein [Planctomycetes bacterium]|nr:DUF4129 domain-containing protein [Planctomycetota bacterium]
MKRTLDYPGWRGKIVRLYLEFLDHAARLGRRRRPAATPAEFAAELGDSAPVLSEIFERARWGPDNPTPHDFYRASQASRQLLSTLRQAMVK